MPLGEFQEGLRLRQGMPLTTEAQGRRPRHQPGLSPGHAEGGIGARGPAGGGMDMKKVPGHSDMKM